jgi:hypothetical protein
MPPKQYPYPGKKIMNLEMKYQYFRTTILAQVKHVEKATDLRFVTSPVVQKFLCRF